MSNSILIDVNNPNNKIQKGSCSGVDHCDFFVSCPRAESLFDLWACPIWVNDDGGSGGAFWPEGCQEFEDDSDRIEINIEESNPLFNLVMVHEYGHYLHYQLRRLGVFKEENWNLFWASWKEKLPEGSYASCNAEEGVAELYRMGKGHREKCPWEKEGIPSELVEEGLQALRKYGFQGLV